MCNMVIQEKWHIEKMAYKSLKPVLSKTVFGDVW